MEPIHALGNDPEVQHLIDTRNRLAHETLHAMLDGRHELASNLLKDYQLAAFHVRTAEDIVHMWDRAVAEDDDD